MAKKNHRPKETMVSSEPSQGTPSASAAPVAGREVVVSPGFVSTYANDVQVQMTPWDMRLILGEITDLPSPSDPVVKVKALAEVRMSPQLAKRLTMVMLGQLKAYEDEYGAIPLR